MTFEELNRAIEFIIEQQARLSATLDRAQERSRQDYEWSKGMIKQLAVSNQRVVDLKHCAQAFRLAYRCRGRHCRGCRQHGSSPLRVDLTADGADSIPPQVRSLFREGDRWSR